MRKPSIQVVNTDAKQSVIINGVRVKCYCIQHSRALYVHKGIIVKLNDYFHLNQTPVEIAIWKKIHWRHRRYFMALIDYEEGKHGWVAQRFLKFRKDHPDHLYKDIRRIARRYKICDIDPDWNWAVKRNGHPVIYDWGC